VIALLEAFVGKGVDYSEQCLLYYSSQEDGGFSLKRLNYIKNYGLYYEKDCPYNQFDRYKILRI